MRRLDGATRWSVLMGHLDRAPGMGLLDGTPGQGAVHPENRVQKGSRLTRGSLMIPFHLVHLNVFHVYRLFSLTTMQLDTHIHIQLGSKQRNGNTFN
jgi:hypothetical protein